MQHGYGHGPPMHVPPAAMQQEWLRSEAGRVVAPQGAPWPDRCVKCNAPAEGFRVKQQIYWHSPWLYLLVLPGVLIYAIVALVTRKSYVGHVGLCPTHRKRRTLLRTAGVFVSLSSLGSCAVTNDPGVAIGGGVLLFLAGLVLVQIGTFVIRPKKITDTYAWLKCGRPFVDALPPAGASAPQHVAYPPPGRPLGPGGR